MSLLGDVIETQYELERAQDSLNRYGHTISRDILEENVEIAERRFERALTAYEDGQHV